MKKNYMHFINTFFSELSGRQRLFLFVFTLPVFAILFVALTQQIENTLLVTGIILAALLITRKIWLPEGYGKNTIRRLSLLIMLALAGSLTFWGPLADAFLQHMISLPWIHVYLPFLKGFQIPPRTSSVSVFLFMLAGVFIVNYFMHDTSAMKAHSQPIDKIFPKKTLRNSVMHFVECCGMNSINWIEKPTGVRNISRLWMQR